MSPFVQLGRFQHFFVQIAQYECKQRPSLSLSEPFLGSGSLECYSIAGLLICFRTDRVIGAVPHQEADIRRFAAQSAAPQVLVKVKKIPATGIISSKTAAMPKLFGECQQRPAFRSTGSTYLLEVSLVCLWPIFATLKDDKRNCANDGDEIEGQVHEVPYDRARGELCERFAHNFSKSRDSVACSARLDLTLFGNKLGVPSNVSIRLSSIKIAFESTVVNVLLSLRTSRAVLKAARGPEVKKSTAS
ncbi:hypothetical protein KC333_g48 [Hortaea werneckii]|nr:hypothetical protein KC333_g48 [Hortaea werneckii]